MNQLETAELEELNPSCIVEVPACQVAYTSGLYERKLPDQISLAQFCDVMEVEAGRVGGASYADNASWQGVTSTALRSRLQRESEEEWVARKRGCPAYFAGVTDSCK